MERESIRPPPKGNGWAPTEPEHERKAREAAWQAYRSCRDCKHWQFYPEDEDEDGTCIGCCCHPEYSRVPAAMLAPEDYTCRSFEVA